MVLLELGQRLRRALAKSNKVTVLDQKAVAECLNDIERALFQADVQHDLVEKLSINVKKHMRPDELAAGHNKRRILQEAVFKELCALLDAGKPAYTPQKGSQCVVMFVGLQGSGKTTTCTKYAHYYRKRGWRPTLVCADTFRAGAFDQLKQNAAKANIPFYGCYTQSDPVTIAMEGVQKFKRENSDLIIIDTSGRHKQESSLFEEMRQVSEIMRPDLIIFVVDSSIGQVAFDQAQGFSHSVPVGAVIITKMDGHARGGGALSAVAATKSPVIFIGTGEHMDDFEPFQVKPFVSRLLGMGDVSGFMNKMHDTVSMEQQAVLLQKLSEGTFTFRIMYDQFQNILRLGSLNQIFSMIPGFSSDFMQKGGEKEGQARIKKFMVIMDSMTNAELDSTNPKMLSEPSRVNRLASGSGHKIKDVEELTEEYKRLAKLWSKMKGLKVPTRGGMRAMARNVNAGCLDKVLPPEILKGVGGVEGLQSLIKQMGSKNFEAGLRTFG